MSRAARLTLHPIVTSCHQWFNPQDTQGSDPSGSADNENGQTFLGSGDNDMCRGTQMMVEPYF